VCEVAGKIIETAKVEVSYLQTVGGRGSGFIPQGLLPASKPADDAIPAQRLSQK
jgi:hypothetical protein